jgi:hypothetical protein
MDQWEELRLLNKADMTIEELQQAGHNIDPLMTECWQKEDAILIQIRDAANSKEQCVAGVPRYLAKSGWFKALIAFQGQQPEQIEVSLQVHVMCRLLTCCANVTTLGNKNSTQCSQDAARMGKHDKLLWFDPGQLPCMQMPVKRPEYVDLAFNMVDWLHNGRMPYQVKSCQYSLLVLLWMGGYYVVPALVDEVLQWLLVQLQPGSQPAWHTLT